TREALEQTRAAVRPGAHGRAIYDIACEVYEQAGIPTQRTKAEGEVLRDGFFHGLGHGVGLEVHEEPGLGRSGDELVAGDVVTIEPGTYRQGYGGASWTRPPSSSLPGSILGAASFFDKEMSMSTRSCAGC